MAKIKEKRIVKGKSVCTDDTNKIIVRIVSNKPLPESEIVRHLKRINK